MAHRHKIYCRSESEVRTPTLDEAGDIKFKPGGIHTEEVYKFWKHELKAGKWVQEVLENGYIIPFNELPQKYEEANNEDATEDADETAAADRYEDVGEQEDEEEEEQHDDEDEDEEENDEQ